MFEIVQIYGYGHAAKYLRGQGIMKKCSRQYVYKLVRQGKLKSTLEEVPGAAFPLNVFMISDLNNLRRVK